MQNRKLAFDPAFGKDATVVLTTAVDWSAGTMFQVGDRIIVSGTLSSSLGKSWPRPMLWMLKQARRVGWEFETFVENAFYDLQAAVETMFGYKFGPQQYKILSCVASSCTCEPYERTL